MVEGRYPLVGIPLRGALHAFTAVCTHMAQKEFSPAERQNIVKYLNDQFYRFQ